jgi:hypothetical protein
MQPFHGAKELIESNAVLQVPLSAVQGRARVFSLERFQGLSRVGALDFFARLAYRVSGSARCEVWQCRGWGWLEGGRARVCGRGCIAGTAAEA